MTDYLLLYSGGKMPETEAEQADVMKAWDVWMTSIGPALKDGGNPFTQEAKTIDPMGKVTDGPAGSPASGYSIISADSLDSSSRHQARITDASTTNISADRRRSIRGS